jgi:hypothetical protein
MKEHPTKNTVGKKSILVTWLRQAIITCVKQKPPPPTA